MIGVCDAALAASQLDGRGITVHSGICSPQNRVIAPRGKHLSASTPLQGRRPGNRTLEHANGERLIHGVSSATTRPEPVDGTRIVEPLQIHQPMLGQNSKWRIPEFRRASMR